MNGLQILNRGEMQNIMAGNGSDPGEGGQECNCLYCYDGLGQIMTTYPVTVGECNFNPNIACQTYNWDSGNFGLC